MQRLPVSYVVCLILALVLGYALGRIVTLHSLSGGGIEIRNEVER